jgi:hypothetical protein
MVMGRSGQTREKVKRVLDAHTGRSAANYYFWHVVPGSHNRQDYAENYGVDGF